MSDALYDETIAAPGYLSLLLELRVGLEMALGVSAAPVLALQPPGDGHPVMVIPGFLTSDGSTVLLRSLLAIWGYKALKWQLGVNLRLNQSMVDKVAERLRSLRREHGRKLSLIGWSLGGVLAREAARANPDDVRQVITLASPFAWNFKATSLRRLYEGINKGNRSRVSDDLVRQMKEPVPVPSTAFYTRSDGIVAWEACVDSVEGPSTENIAIPGSHCGLVYNPIALAIVSNRLRQQEGSWRRYDEVRH